LGPIPNPQSPISNPQLRKLNIKMIKEIKFIFISI